ncbi:probable fatty acyl-CoA reductase 4 isoform X1 [Quercus lobata]|uniref:probable fatty acyl-CoA reductase 4 isoform X1 n=1 Tax=Quercus lobata TaxID=97700 RepID=UPI001245D4C9|nr:probable fatty acyl-CoA reductase 4 isoform X1 [Quercus lobata]
MELEGILQFFENKTILVTGTTGFLAKVFVEKILRVQPNVKRFSLLVRASNNQAATQRFREEVIKKDIFRILRNNLGANLESFIFERVTPISGDISYENFGIKDSILIEEMWKDIDIVLNSAATTNFDERAKLYGWPNTYVYTKALGEMLLEQFHQNLPLAIVRPTMVTSTYKEPFSGWIEGARTIDGVITAFGKGRLKSFLGHPNSILDVIPADMVVNSIIMAMVTHANKSSQIIFHVGSSLRNPMKLPSLSDLISLYFTQNPWIDRNGKSIKVSKLIVFSNIATFQAYMAIRYKLPLKVLWLANLMLCQYYREIRINLNRKVRVVMRMVDLYKPYAFFTGSFDDSNTENLRVAIRESDVDVNLFYFDPRCIDWEDYIMNTHIPGLTKYSMKP